MHRTALLHAAFLLLASCAGRSEKLERSAVSARVEERTGVGIGSGSPPGTVTVPDGVSLEDGISEDEAVAIALWNNAAFQEALSELGIKQAELIQAGLLTNPVFSILFPVGPKQMEFTLNVPLEAIWRRPYRVAAAELDGERVAVLLVENGLETVYQVRTAFADLRRIQEQEDAVNEVVRVCEEIAAVYDARLRAGDVSELEASQARLKALQARSKAARLSREAAGARDRLTGLLGFANDPRELRYEPTAQELPNVAENQDQLLKRALACRPDLRAAELTLEAAGERAGLARWQLVSLAAILDANEEGEKGFEIGPGLAVEVPLFDWQQGDRALAAADLERAARHYSTVRDRIITEVREAYTGYLQVQEELGAWRREILPALQVSRNLAEKAEKAGDTSILSVLEWNERLLQGRIDEGKLTADLYSARARLERTVGSRLGGEPATADAGKR